MISKLILTFWIGSTSSVAKSIGVESSNPENRSSQGSRTICDGEALFLEPARIVTLDGRELSLDQLLGDWDRDLGSRGITTSLQTHFQEFVELRRQIIEQLDSLVHFPINWLSGRPTVAELVDRYLRTASQIYGQVQRHYRDMQDVDEGWARAVLEGVLALDIVQVRCELDGRARPGRPYYFPHIHCTCGVISGS